MEATSKADSTTCSLTFGFCKTLLFRRISDILAYLSILVVTEVEGVNSIIAATAGRAAFFRQYKWYLLGMGMCLSTILALILERAQNPHLVWILLAAPGGAVITILKGLFRGGGQAGGFGSGMGGGGSGGGGGSSSGGGASGSF